MTIVGTTPAAQLMSDLARNYEITRQSIRSVLNSAEQQLLGSSTATTNGSGSLSSTSSTPVTTPQSDEGQAALVGPASSSARVSDAGSVVALGNTPGEITPLSGGQAPYTGLLGTSLGAGVAVVGATAAARYLPVGWGVGSDIAPYTTTAPGALVPKGAVSDSGGPGGVGTPAPGTAGPASPGRPGGLGPGLGSDGAVSSAAGLGASGAIAGVADRPPVPSASPSLSVMSNGGGAPTANSPMSGGGGANAVASAGRMGGMGGMGMMGGGMGAGGKGGSSRRIPPWLVETENVWGESAMVTPAVIGDDVATAPPPGRAGSLPRSGVAR